MLQFLEVPIVLFLVIVLPIWLVLHYRSQRVPMSSINVDADGPEVADLWQTARRMEERIRTLERILDADTPNWRGRM
jgi:phage shock protein B